MSATKRRHILVVTAWLPTRARPEAGIFVRRDIELLTRMHDVDVVHLTDGQEAEPIAGVRKQSTIFMAPKQPLSILRAGRALLEESVDYDLLHTMAASALLPFIAGRMTRPWVHTEHWSGLLNPRSLPLLERVTLPATRVLLKKPDVVVAVGHALADEISRRRGRRETPIVANAVRHPEQVVASPPTPPLRLLSVGGLVPGKGPDLAVEAVSELVSRNVDATLTWLGDGPMRDEVAALVNRLDLAGRVNLAGAVSPERVQTELASAHLFLLPTVGETFGVAIAEALVAGRPVVVGAHGEQSRFVTEPDGMLVSERTPRAFADAIQRVWSFNANREATKIGMAARTAFTEESREAAYTQIYRDAEDIADDR